jgi:hypothetical protein
LHLRTDPAHDPASLLVLLQRRNQELAGVLADRGGSIDEVDARLDVSRNVGPDPLLRPAAIVRAPFGSRDTARDAPERPEVADQLKALCLALGNSAIEFPDLCTDETLAATAPAN